MNARVSAKTQKRLLLVRHGLPDYSTRLPGDELPGPPLSSRGFSQAQQAADVVAAYEPEAVYASPLSRTRQTGSVIAGRLGVSLDEHADLREWHRTERLYDVNQRAARFLSWWLMRHELCAVAVGHASPLLSLMRTALYLPHLGWWKPGHPEVLELGACDRFEVSMASVFELTIEAAYVTVRRLFHPTPRILHVRNGRALSRLPRPTMGGENDAVRRPNMLHFSGVRYP